MSLDGVIPVTAGSYYDKDLYFFLTAHLVIR